MGICVEPASFCRVYCARQRQIRCEAEADGYSPDGRRFSRDTANAAATYDGGRVFFAMEGCGLHIYLLVSPSQASPSQFSAHGGCCRSYPIAVMRALTEGCHERNTAS